MQVLPKLLTQAHSGLRFKTQHFCMLGSSQNPQHSLLFETTCQVQSRAPRPSRRAHRCPTAVGGWGDHLTVRRAPCELASHPSWLLDVGKEIESNKERAESTSDQDYKGKGDNYEQGYLGNTKEANGDLYSP